MNDKLETLKTLFGSCSSQEEIYKTIIEWGKKCLPLDPTLKTEERRVVGCQSLLYLFTLHKEGRLYFQIDSDALISKGLAALLAFYYEGATPLQVIQEKPTFLEELSIVQSLSPTRAGGVASLYVKMRQEALRFLTVQC